MYEFFDSFHFEFFVLAKPETLAQTENLKRQDGSKVVLGVTFAFRLRCASRRSRAALRCLALATRTTCPALRGEGAREGESRKCR